MSLIPPPLPIKPQGVFITGTNTGVGKTFISALLTKAWDATYWKPFQTGLAEEQGDTETVSSLINLPPQRIIPPISALQAPLCPYSAALQENITLNIDEKTIKAHMPPASHNPLIIEGAGGLMVPITKDKLLIDIIKYFNVPVIVVSENKLGTLNHTLLSIEALYRRNIPILGFIMNQGKADDNQKLIEERTHIKCLFTMPYLSPPLPITMINYLDSVPAWQKLSDPT